ncbi:hypothetical protein ACRRTK_004584 [Alexandromys fortis]
MAGLDRCGCSRPEQLLPGSETLPGKEHCLSCRWWEVGPHFSQRTSKLKVKYCTPTL